MIHMKFHTLFSQKDNKMVFAMQKCIFSHMQTEKAQINMHIHTVWSGP